MKGEEGVDEEREGREGNEERGTEKEREWHDKRKRMEKGGEG